MGRTHGDDDRPAAEQSFEALGGAAEVTAGILDGAAHAGPAALVGVVAALTLLPVAWLLRRRPNK